MTALALALCFLGALAFAAFWRWLDRVKPAAQEPGQQQMNNLRAQTEALEQRFSNFELRMGLGRVERKP